MPICPSNLYLQGIIRYKICSCLSVSLQVLYRLRQRTQFNLYISHILMVSHNVSEQYLTFSSQHEHFQYVKQSQKVSICGFCFQSTFKLKLLLCLPFCYKVCEVSDLHFYNQITDYSELSRYRCVFLECNFVIIKQTNIKIQMYFNGFQQCKSRNVRGRYCSFSCNHKNDIQTLEILTAYFDVYIGYMH